MRVVLFGLIGLNFRSHRRARQIPLLLTSLAANQKKNCHLQRDIHKVPRNHSHLFCLLVSPWLVPGISTFPKIVDLFRDLSHIIRINFISLLDLSQLHAFEIANCNNGCLENEDIQRPLRPQNLKTKTPRFLYTCILLHTCTLLEKKIY